MSLLIKFFDFVKRMNMDKIYNLANPWGRDGYTGDIDAAISLVSDRTFQRCLDVGTGLGHYAERAARVCGHVLAIDISPSAIKRARGRLSEASNITFKAENIRNFNPQTRFDLIILGDILYYMGDVRFPRKFSTLITHISSLAIPGGVVLMSNFISPNRPKIVLSAYIDAFLSCGFIVEKHRTFRDGKRCWEQVVLIKTPQN